jgi:hypothetical protein
MSLGLAHSGGNGVSTPVMAPAHFTGQECIAHTPHGFQHEITLRDSRRRFHEYILDVEETGSAIRRGRLSAFSSTYS